MKLAGQQANEALAKGEISQSQYDALQREIVETEKALEELEKQADKSAVALQKIGAAGEKLKNMGSSIEGVGKKLMPVTAAVGGLGIAAVSGATGKDLDALREKAREMESKTKFSASEAAEAMNYMAMAGWKTGDMAFGSPLVALTIVSYDTSLGFLMEKHLHFFMQHLQSTVYVMPRRTPAASV